MRKEVGFIYITKDGKRFADKRDAIKYEKEVEVLLRRFIKA